MVCLVKEALYIIMQSSAPDHVPFGFDNNIKVSDELVLAIVLSIHLELNILLFLC